MIEEQHSTSSFARARLRVSPSPFRDDQVYCYNLRSTSIRKAFANCKIVSVWLIIASFRLGRRFRFG